MHHSRKESNAERMDDTTEREEWESRTKERNNKTLKNGYRATLAQRMKKKYTSSGQNSTPVHLYGCPGRDRTERDVRACEVMNEESLQTEESAASNEAKRIQAAPEAARGELKKLENVLNGVMAKLEKKKRI